MVMCHIWHWQQWFCFGHSGVTFNSGLTLQHWFYLGNCGLTFFKGVLLWQRGFIMAKGFYFGNTSFTLATVVLLWQQRFNFGNCGLTLAKGFNFGNTGFSWLTFWITIDDAVTSSISEIVLGVTSTVVKWDQVKQRELWNEFFALF